MRTGKFAFVISLVVSASLVSASVLPAFAWSPQDGGYDLRAYETPGAPGPLPKFSEAPRRMTDFSGSTHRYESRGGRYTDADNQAIEAALAVKSLRYRGGEELFSYWVLASISAVPFLYGGSAGASGGAMPGETSVGGWNSNTGNKLTEIELFKWNARGNTSVDMTLYHNSAATDRGLFGYSWSSTYEATIMAGTGTDVIVKWGDGSTYIFDNRTPSGSDYVWNTPPGCFDSIKKAGSLGNYTITRHDFSTWTFDTNGRLLSTADRSGNSVDVTYYGSSFEIERVTDANGRYLEISYDGNGDPSTVTDAAGEKYHFGYSTKKITAIEFPSVATGTHQYEFAYNARKQITTLTDLRGHDWTFAYETVSPWRLTQETDPTARDTWYSYNQTRTVDGTSSAGWAIITDEASEERMFKYGTFGSISATKYDVDEAGYFVEYTSYNADYLPLSLEDRRGNVWEYTYDGNGNKLTIENPLNEVWTMTYTAKNDINTVTTPKGYVTDYDYNGAHLLSQIHDALTPTPRTTEFDYDAYGQLETIRDNDGEEKDLVRTGNDDVTTIRDERNIATTVTYDTFGRPTGVNAPEGTGDDYEYDKWGRITKVTHQDASTILIERDASDNITKVTDELGHDTTYTYDNAGRLVSVTNEKSEVETTYYNAVGDVDYIKNAKNENRYYYFSERHELTSIALPGYGTGKREWWSYDGNGNVASKKNPIDQITYYTHDAANRMTYVNYLTGNDITYNYDDDNRLTSMSDGTGTTTYNYNSASEITSIAAPQGTVSYTYDSIGRRATMTEGALVTTYGYDIASRLTSIQNGYGETTTLTYDDANRLEKKELHHGMWEDYGYDNRNRMTSMAIKKPGSPSPVTEYAESYDYEANGNLNYAIKDGQTTTYDYDAIDQLITEEIAGTWKQTYTYDANGNRTSFKKYLSGSGTPSVDHTYSYNPGDLLMTAGPKTFTYDNCGRMKTVSENSVLQKTYHYDYQDRLITTQYPDGTGTSDTYLYNGMHARVSQTINGTTRTYKRDGTSVTSPVLTEGGRQHTPGVSYRESSATKYGFQDRLGTNTHEFNTSNVETSQKDFDAFGNEKSTSGSTNNPFGFAGNWGYQKDSSSGLQLLGHRYYDPTIGRFLTRDPIKDGRNWFTYAENNPLKRVDADGLQSQAIEPLQRLKGGSQDSNERARIGDLIERLRGDKEFRERVHREIGKRKKKGGGGGKGGPKSGSGGKGPAKNPNLTDEEVLDAVDYVNMLYPAEPKREIVPVWAPGGNRDGELIEAIFGPLAAGYFDPFNWWIPDNPDWFYPGTRGLVSPVGGPLGRLPRIGTGLIPALKW